MNGRIYDPLLGRFLSADLVVQAPGSLQSYNRYSYVMNNPLSLTDPSGYVWWNPFSWDWSGAFGGAKRDKGSSFWSPTYNESRANQEKIQTELMDYIREQIQSGAIRPGGTYIIPNSIDGRLQERAIVITAASDAASSGADQASGDEQSDGDSLPPFVVTCSRAEAERAAQLYNIAQLEIASAAYRHYLELQRDEEVYGSLRTAASAVPIFEELSWFAVPGCGLVETAIGIRSVAVGAMRLTGYGGRQLGRMVYHLRPGSKALVAIGHYSESGGYKAIGRVMNARTYQVPTALWNAWTPAQRWAVNRGFLDALIANRSEVFLATTLDELRASSSFAAEVEYLMKKGYRLVFDSEGRMIERAVPAAK